MQGPRRTGARQRGRGGRAIVRGRAVSTTTIRAKLLTVSSDAKWIIGTMGGLVIAVAGLLSAQISGLNTRIDDLDTRLNTRIDELDARLNTRIDELDARLSARIDDTNTRIDELRADVRELRAALVRVDERLDAVEVAAGRIDQRLAVIERVVLPSPPAGG